VQLELCPDENCKHTKELAMYSITKKKRRRKQKAKGILEVNPGNFLMCRLWVLSSSRDPSYAQPFPSTHHD
jgi:hypothetical protein